MTEAEFALEAECHAFVPPDLVVVEVTHDLRFTGGQLALTDAAALRQPLVSFGL